jgi:hypothetical protein
MKIKDGKGNHEIKVKKGVKDRMKMRKSARKYESDNTVLNFNGPFPTI